MYIYVCIIISLYSITSAAEVDWRIIGGFPADDGQFPHQISLQNNSNHICGGSIINDKYILTAAHCFLYISNIQQQITIVTGTNQLDSGGTTYQVAKAIIHDEFDKENMVNDIALIQVIGTITFNEKVKPIPLETDTIPVGSDVVLSGWGYINSSPIIPNDLQYLVLKSISNEDCRDYYSNIAVTIEDYHLCTFTQTGQGACDGDSGGPLIYNGKLAGIVSWGYPCAIGYPDVFTRVSDFLHWILDNLV